MNLPPDLKLTSQVLWRAALATALVDLAFVALLAWRFRPARFRQLKWALVLTTGVFFAALWGWVLDWAWDSVYSYLFPQWMRTWLPLWQGCLSAAVALLFWSAAVRFSNPVIAFPALGGLWGLVTHIWAVYLGVVDKPPMLQGASPAAAVVFAIFEFIFYWCLIMSIALIGWYAWQRSTRLVRRQIEASKPRAPHPGDIKR